MGITVDKNGEDGEAEDVGVLRIKVKQKITRRKVRDGGGDILKKKKTDE